MISTISKIGEHGSPACSHDAVRASRKRTTDTTQTRRGFHIRFSEYVKEMYLIQLPSHRRENRSQASQAALDGNAMSPTSVGAFLTVDGPSTRSLTPTNWQESCNMDQYTSQYPCTSLREFLVVTIHRCWMDYSTRRYVGRMPVGLYISHTSSYLQGAAVKHVRPERSASGDDETI